MNKSNHKQIILFTEWISIFSANDKIKWIKQSSSKIQGVNQNTVGNCAANN